MPYVSTSEAQNIFALHVQRIVAFVVGINNYKRINKLKNCVHDAQAIRDILEKQGVEVVYLENCTISQLKEKEAEYMTYVKRGYAALFFFAGHGCTFKNEPRMLTIAESNEHLVSRDSLNLYALLAK